MNKKGLGKGLGALIPGSNMTTLEKKDMVDYGNNQEKIKFIPLNKIISNPNQPRKDFNKEKIEELAQSIKENGLIQPIIVREIKNEYQIIAGERRYRACVFLKLKEIPAIIKNFSDEQTSKIALIENIQREDLNPIEEASAYKSLIEEYGLKQLELAEVLGKSRSSITNTMRLLELPNEVLEMIKEEIIMMGHGRALLGIESSKKRIEIAKEIAEKGYSVRQTEALVKKAATNKTTKEIFKIENIEIKRIEENLQERLGTKVEIKGTENKGKIQIEYYNMEDLERIIDIVQKK